MPRGVALVQAAAKSVGGGHGGGSDGDASDGDGSDGDGGNRGGGVGDEGGKEIGLAVRDAGATSQLASLPLAGGAALRPALSAAHESNRNNSCKI